MVEISITLRQPYVFIAFPQQDITATVATAAAAVPKTVICIKERPMSLMEYLAR
jgi:poly(3-hydroxybutyrate) depolymerase